MGLLEGDDVAFVGRELLLLEVGRFARRLGPGFVLITGETGVGKTRLATEIAQRRAGLGHWVARAHFRRGSVDDLLPLTALASVDSPETAGPGRVAVLAEAFVQGVLQRCAMQPGVVQLDDCQWMTPAAAELVGLLLDQAEDQQAPLLLVATASDDDQTGVSAELDRVTRDHASLRLSLEPMTEEETLDVLLDATRSARADPALVGRIHRQCAGNPLFALAIIRQLQSQGAIAVRDGVLRTTARVGITMPAALVQLWQAQLASLETPARRTIEAAALLRRPIADELLCSLCGVDTRVIDGLVDIGLLVETHDDEVVVARERLADVVVAGMGMRAREQMRSDLAFGLAERAVHPTLAAGLLIAGNGQPDAELLWRIGTHALSELQFTGSWGAVAELSGAVTDAGVRLLDAGQLTSAVALPQLAIDSGLAHARDSNATAASYYYATASTVARQLADVGAEAVASSYAARAQAFIGFEVPDRAAVARLTSLVDSLDESDAERKAHVLCTMSELLNTTDPDSSRELANAALGVAKATNDSAALSQAHLTLGLQNLADLRLDEASLDFGTTRQLTRGKDPYLYACALSRFALSELPQGRTLDDELRAEMHEAVTSAGGWVERLLVEASEASSALAAGDLGEASARANRAMRHVRRSEYYLGPLLVYPQSVVASALLGDYEAAEAALTAWQTSSPAGSHAYRLWLDVLTGRDEAVASGLAQRPIELRFRGTPDVATFGLAGAIADVAFWLDARSAAPLIERASASIAETPLRSCFNYPMSAERLAGIGAWLAGDAARAMSCFERGARVAQANGRVLEELQCRLGIARTRGDKDLLGEVVGDLEDVGAVALAELAYRAWPQSINATTSVPVDSVAVLLTDVVDSTAIGDRLGDAAFYKAIQVHDRVVLAALRRHGGVAFDHTGDGQYAWFDSATEALFCARSIHKGLQQATRELGHPLQARAAVILGRPFVRNGRIYGAINILAARACSVGAPGQTVFNESAVDALQGIDLNLRPLGPRQLKGFRTPHELWIGP